jgi:hypothetical protein
MCVNGADKMRVFTGSAWAKDGDGAPYDITGVDTTTVVNISIFKNRICILYLWFFSVFFIKRTNIPYPCIIYAYPPPLPNINYNSLGFSIHVKNFYPFLLNKKIQIIV